MTKYSRKLVEIISELLENDMSVTEVCNAVGINRKTFYEWKNTNPEFAQAVDDARERAYDELIALARRTLRDRIEGYTVEETTFTYEPASYDESEMILKKKVVKRKRKEPSITSLNNMIQCIETKTKSTRSNSRNTLPQIAKKGIVTPSNSQEAFTLAHFFLKLEQGCQLSKDKKHDKSCSNVLLFNNHPTDLKPNTSGTLFSDKKQ